MQLLLDRAHDAGLVPKVTAEYAPEPETTGPGIGNRESGIEVAGNETPGNGKRETGNEGTGNESDGR